MFWSVGKNAASIATRATIHLRIVAGLRATREAKHSRFVSA